ncbi:MAG: hypothetical protein U0172_02685 [Nitrospiraceae bacterium]
MTVADLSLAAYFILMVGISVWALQGGLSRGTKGKYPSSLIYRSQLPFFYKWREAIVKEDLQEFERARVRHLITFSFAILLPVLLATYAYVNTAALLWRCTMHGAGS